MARATSIRVDGLREIGQRFRELGADFVARAAPRATVSAAKLVLQSAKARVPVDTGALRAGLVVKRLPKSETDLTSEHIVTVSTRQMRKYVEKSRSAIVELQGPTRPRVVNGKTIRPKKLLGRKESYEDLGSLYYGHFIEFGTAKMSPRPFLRPAFDESITQAIQAIKSSLATDIESAK